MNEKQGKVNELEDAARPVKDRLEEINNIRKALLEEETMLAAKFQELNSSYERQNKELDMLKPTQREAQNQLDQCNKLFQDCEKRSADIASILQNEMRTLQEFESKAKEAHREVHDAEILEQQANEGRNSILQSSDQFNSRVVELEQELRDIQRQIGQFEQGGYGPQFEHKKEEFERCEGEYKNLIEEERNVKGRNDSIGHQIGHLESQLRTAQQSLETSRGHPRKDYASRIRAELETIERDLYNAKTDLPQLDQNPYESELKALERKESEVEAHVYSFWTPQRAPPSLINQLKREAEAVLRAEAALSLERRQKAICDEAKNLSRYHINTAPSIDIDEEARTTLLKEHKDGDRVPDRQIAKTVLEMCEQHHIHG
jgi:chromosome segregation ATPase